jgi:hypothetical protein
MGEFIRVHCRHCGQTYLTTVANPTEEGLPTQCDMCRKPGGLVGGDAALLEAERQQKRQAQPMGPYPISRFCPDCGGGEFRTARPNRWVAFTQDRICEPCGIRYTPPTPWWAGVVFIIVGIALAGFGLFGVVAGLAQGNPIPVACEGLLSLLGFLAIVQGIRSLVSPGRA